MPTELVEFRKRIGQARFKLILQESIRINGKDGHGPTLSAGTTIQNKNITYPIDDKLYKRFIIKWHFSVHIKTGAENIIYKGFHHFFIGYYII